MENYLHLSFSFKITLSIIILTKTACDNRKKITKKNKSTTRRLAEMQTLYCRYFGVPTYLAYSDRQMATEPYICSKD